MEERYKNHLDNYYETIANHYFESENYNKAAEFYKLAARKAQRVVSFADAISFSEKLVECIERLPRTQEIEMKRIDARTVLGFYYCQTFQFGPMKSVIDPIIDLAEKYDYKKRLAQIYYMIGTNSLYIEEDLHKSANYLGRAIQIGEETDNLNAVIMSNHYLGHVLVDECKFEKAYQHINKALEIVKMVNSQFAIAMNTSCIAYNIYFYQGKIDLAYKTSREGLQLADDSGDILSKVEAYMSHGLCSYGKGLFDEAEAHLTIGLELGKRADDAFVYLCNLYLGVLFQLKGNYPKAIEHYEDILSYESYNIHSTSHYNLVRIRLASAKVMVDDKDIDVNTLSKFLSENRIRKKLIY